MAQEPKYDTIDLSDLLAKRHRVVNVTLGDGLGITATWKPDALSPAVFAQMTETFGAGQGVTDPFVIARDFVVPLLDSWSLTEGGQPYPITAETVGGLGLVIVKLIGEALMRDFNRVMSPEEIADTKGPSAA